ncbi:hypothetical protein K439DRAFT_1610193 [Ramaria rubella]|nr:hypothetical protein K439DRAFT_1610193 [Ramaria rubella]
MSLWAQKAWKYMDGTSTKPTEKAEAQEWLEINDQIVGALGTVVDPSLQHELESITEALTTWKRLQDKTQSTGIIARLKSMQAAIRNRVSPDTPFSTTITKIRDALAIFNGTPPTNEEWLIMLLLNALSDGDDWLRKDLIMFMTNSNMQLSVKDIIERIETEARELRGTTRGISPGR